jgi:flagellar hook-associated protein 2
MAEGILGLGSSGSNSLNQELIDKLKEAEAKSKVKPYEEDLEDWDKELEKITEIEGKMKEFLTTLSKLDLYNTGPDVFEQVTASSTGSAAVFDAYDASGLEEGSNSITVTQLAQRDVFQTSKFSDSEALITDGQDSGDKIVVSVAGETLEFSTEGKTYKELAEEMNAHEKLIVSVEQVSGSESRLVIKSKESGVDNALSIQQTGVDFGFGNGMTKTLTDQAFDPTYSSANITGIVINGDTIDGFPNGSFSNYNDIVQAINNYKEGGVQQYQATTSYDSLTREFTFNIKALDGSTMSVEEIGDGDGSKFSDPSHVSVAKNMKASVDGIDYDVASNTLTIQGNLTMTAIELGTSTISIQKDHSQILPTVQDMVSKYNEIVDLIDGELYSAETPIDDLSSLRMMMGSIKDKLFGNYGASDDKNLFNYGFSVDKTGHLSVDSTEFAKALGDDAEGMKDLFIGTAEKPGLGTQLKEYVDELDGFDGLLTLYGETMADRKTALEADKEKAQETLDTKYSLMSEQFAAYTAIITQMEASFGGLKMMIQQSTSGN